MIEQSHVYITAFIACILCFWAFFAMWRNPAARVDALGLGYILVGLAVLVFAVEYLIFNLDGTPVEVRQFWVRAALIWLFISISLWAVFGIFMSRKGKQWI